jgi:hypothetical protein
MDKDPFETRSSIEPRRSLHILGNHSRNEEGRIDHSRASGKTWFGVVVIALLVFCVIGLTVSKERTNVIQPPSPEQVRIEALAEQLSSLTQTDLIVFPDGRVWYVRSVHGKNLEVIGWVGDNVRSENIDSLVLREDHLMIVRHHDPGWPAQRDRFLDQ